VDAVEEEAVHGAVRRVVPVHVRHRAGAVHVHRHAVHDRAAVRHVAAAPVRHAVRHPAHRHAAHRVHVRHEEDEAEWMEEWNWMMI